MKKSLTILAALAIAVSAYGQGQIGFNNNVSGQVRAYIYGPETSDATLAVYGNISSGTPAGTAVYTGARLAGSSYSAQLFGGPANTVDSTTLQATTVLGNPFILNFKTGASAGLVDNPSGQVVDVPGVLGGSTATIQMRAWNNAGGTINTYAAAVSAVGGQFGESTLFQSQPLSTAPNPTVPSLVGLTGFNIHTVPEPSTIALGVIGLAGFLARRRKQ